MGRCGSGANMPRPFGLLPAAPSWRSTQGRAACCPRIQARVLDAALATYRVWAAPSFLGGLPADNPLAIGFRNGPLSAGGVGALSIRQPPWHSGGTPARSLPSLAAQAAGASTRAWREMATSRAAENRVKTKSDIRPDACRPPREYDLWPIFNSAADQSELILN